MKRIAFCVTQRYLVVYNSKEKKMEVTDMALDQKEWNFIVLEEIIPETLHAVSGSHFLFGAVSVVGTVYVWSIHTKCAIWIQKYRILKQLTILDSAYSTRDGGFTMEGFLLCSNQVVAFSRGKVHTFFIKTYFESETMESLYVSYPYLYILFKSKLLKCFDMVQGKWFVSKKLESKKTAIQCLKARTFLKKGWISEKDKEYYDDFAATEDQTFPVIAQSRFGLTLLGPNKCQLLPSCHEKEQDNAIQVESNSFGIVAQWEKRGLKWIDLREFSRSSIPLLLQLEKQKNIGNFLTLNKKHDDGDSYKKSTE